MREQLVLGVRVRRLREAQGLTQEKLAELGDLGVKHLQAIEAGRTSNVQLITLFRLATGLRVPIAVLFGGVVPTRSRRR